MEACTVRGHGALSVFVDFSLVVMTGCGTVCVEACMVWGHDALSVCVNFSLLSTIGGCTESVIVVASIVASMGWAVTFVSVLVSIARDIRFCGGVVEASLLGAGRFKG